VNRNDALSLVRKYGSAILERRSADSAEHGMTLVEALAAPLTNPMRIYFRTNPSTVAFRHFDGVAIVPRVGDQIALGGFRWKATEVVWDFESESPVEVDVFLELVVR
jgi:hypothetical protein